MDKLAIDGHFEVSGLLRLTRVVEVGAGILLRKHHLELGIRENVAAKGSAYLVEFSPISSSSTVGYVYV